MSYFYAFIGMAMLAASMQAMAAVGCGELANAYGPFDYTNPDHRKNRIPVVEKFHFTPQVEHLIKGINSKLGGDIDYTLRAIPNHHRALNSMANLAIKEKRQQPAEAEYSVECYFDRAMRFKPKDGIVHMVYGVYLKKQGKLDKAIEELNEADKLQPNNANIHYNLGLLYVDKKDYELARTHAKKAYQLGFPLAGLKKKLIKAGQWDEQT